MISKTILLIGPHPIITFDYRFYSDDELLSLAKAKCWIKIFASSRYEEKIEAALIKIASKIPVDL